MKCEMTHKERVMNTISRKEVDRFPVQFDFTAQALDKIVDYLKLADRGEQALLQHMDNHIVFAYLNDAMGKIRMRMVTERFIYDDWGVGWDTSQEGTFFSYHPLEDINTYSGYEFPDPDNTELMDFAKVYVPKYKDEYIVASYQAVCIFERAYSLRGFENFLVDMMIDEDFACTLLDKIADYQVRVAERYVDVGVNCGRIGDDYGSQRGLMMSPDLWRRMIKPRLKRVVDVYKGAGLPVILHSCGDVRDIIQDFIEIGIDILHPLQPKAMAVDVIAAKYGDKITFYGGICNQDTLPYGTPEQVEAEVKHLFDIFRANGRGYILGPSNGIATDTPVENIAAMLKAAKKYMYV